MAKVIGWSINSEYLYLGDIVNGQILSPSAQTQQKTLQEVNSLAEHWRYQDFSKYSTAFNQMKAYAQERYTSTSLGNAENYFNVLSENGVIIISGRDGKNIYDEGTPYYTPHVVNENLSLGLGGDYKLDVAVTAMTQLYIERNGVIKNEEILNIVVDGLDSSDFTYSYSTDHLTGFYNLYIGLPVGVTFNNTSHCNKYKITVTANNGYKCISYFSVTGVRDGEEGSFYNLTVNPKIIKKIGSSEYSSPNVTVYVTKNGESLSGMRITYFSGGTERDYTEPINAQLIDAAPDNTVTFLLKNSSDEIIDTETCTVVRDGTDSASAARVELDNEMDGVSLGDSTTLNVNMTVGSGAKIWTGSSEAVITEITLKGISTDSHVSCRVKDGSEWRSGSFSSGVFTKTLTNNSYETVFEINFEEGFTFNSQLKEVITVNLKGQLLGTTFTAETNYIILAIKGGKNGERFRLQPSVDYIFYDPNTDRFSVEVVNCKAYVGTTLITEPEYKICYSINSVYDSFVEGGTIIGDTVDIDTYAISSVTFYLFYNPGGSSYYILDRESVPVVRQGLNGANRVYLELDEEITGLALGGDNVLDNPVTVEVPFSLYSGSTRLPFRKVILDADADFNGFQCDLKIDGGGTLHGVFSNGTVEFNSSEDAYMCTAKIRLESGLTFDSTGKEIITFSVLANEIYYRAVYTILGIKNGADGMAYRLVPSVSAIEYNPNTDAYYPDVLTCDAYIGKDRLIDPNYVVTYSINDSERNFEDTTPIPPAGIIISAGIRRVYLYLFGKFDEYEGWILLDKESVPVVSDGMNSDDRVFLELDEEMTGIAVGNDGVLDVETDVTIPALLYSGATPIDFGGIEIDADSDFNGYSCVLLSDGTEIANLVFNDSKVIYNGLLSNVTAVITLQSGLSFYESTRRELRFKVTRNSDSYSAKYTIVGLKTGEDGVVYRLVPTANQVIYNPNEDPGNQFSPDKLYCEAYQGTEKIESDSRFQIRYTINSTGNSIATTTALTQEIPITVEVKRVYFYLFFYFEEEWFVIDRESIPVVSDGINASDRVSLELDEEVTGIALGGDNVLDVETTIQIPFVLYSGATALHFKEFRIEGDSTLIGCNCSLSYTGGTTASVDFVTEQGITYVEFKNIPNNVTAATANLTLVSGTTFDNTLREDLELMAGYTYKNTDYSASAGYSIFGVKHGEDGMIYRLVPDYSSIIRNPNNDSFFPTRLDCKAYYGNEDITNLPEFAVRYTTGDTPVTSTTDITLSYVIPSGGVPITTSARVFFYLYYKLPDNSWIMIDRESVPVISDGVDASEKVFLELDEEVTGIALGSDKVLDVDVNAEIPFVLYSGSTQLNFVQVELTESSGKFNGICTCYLTYNNLTSDTKTFTSNKVSFTNLSNVNEAVAHIKLGNGLTFDDSGRIIVEFAVTYVIPGTSPVQTVKYTAVYTVIGIPGGVDGESYRLVPSDSSVIYNPNNGGSIYPQRLYCDAFYGAEKMTVGSDKDFWIKYYRGSDTSDISKMTGLTSNGVGVSTNDTKIYFYLLAKNGSNWTIIDKESVPVVREGVDASDLTFVELDEEMTGIGLGQDDRLDKEATVSVPFYLYSGGTKLNFDTVEISASDSSLNGLNCVLTYGTGPTTITRTFASQKVTFTGINGVSTATASITLPVGFEFTTNRKILTFKASYTDAQSNVTSGIATYAIVGVQSGADGESFRLVPEVNSVVYNPDPVSYLPTKVKCDAYNGITKIVFPSTESSDDKYRLRYTVGTSPVTSTGSTSVVPSDGVTPQRNKRIYFYLLVKDGSNYIIIDRESVPTVENGVKGADGYSPFILDLDNQNASINCDSDGNILSGAKWPECTATLYCGSSVATDLGYTVTYSRDAVTNPTGHQNQISVNSSTGQISLVTSGSYKFKFDSGSDKVVFTIMATVKTGSTTIGTYEAKYTITQNLPGANGEPATSYWLEPSMSSIKIPTGDTSGSYTLSCSGKKQIGNGSIETIGSTEGVTIKYGFDSTSTLQSSVTANNTATITSGASVWASHTYVCFKLFSGSTQLDVETVPILQDGKPGPQGDPGTKGNDGVNGLCIRKTVWSESEYVSGRLQPRMYYNGETEDEHGDYPNPDRYYDIVSDKEIGIIGGVGETAIQFYRCIKSHAVDDTPTRIYPPGTISPAGSQDWQTYWERIENSEAIATPLLLANVIDAAYINVGQIDANKLLIKTTSNSNLLYAGRTDAPLICGDGFNTATTLSNFDNDSSIVTWITGDGDIHTKRLFASGGTIGGWFINKSGLTSSNMSIDSYNRKITIYQSTSVKSGITLSSEKFTSLNSIMPDSMYEISGDIYYNYKELVPTSTGSSIDFTHSAATSSFVINEGSYTVKIKNVTAYVECVVYPGSVMSSSSNGKYTLSVQLYNVNTGDVTVLIDKTESWTSLSQFNDVFDRSLKMVCSNKTLTANNVGPGTYHYRVYFNFQNSSSVQKIENYLTFNFNPSITTDKKNRQNYFFNNGHVLSYDSTTKFVAFLSGGSTNKLVFHVESDNSGLYIHETKFKLLGNGAWHDLKFSDVGSPINLKSASATFGDSTDLSFSSTVSKKYKHAIYCHYGASYSDSFQLPNFTYDGDEFYIYIIEGQKMVLRTPNDCSVYLIMNGAHRYISEGNNYIKLTTSTDNAINNINGAYVACTIKVSYHDLPASTTFGEPRTCIVTVH